MLALDRALMSRPRLPLMGEPFPGNRLVMNICFGQAYPRREKGL